MRPQRRVGGSGAWTRRLLFVKLNGRLHPPSLRPCRVRGWLQMENGSFLISLRVRMIRALQHSLFPSLCGRGGVAIRTYIHQVHRLGVATRRQGWRCQPRTPTLKSVPNTILSVCA